MSVTTTGEPKKRRGPKPSGPGRAGLIAEVYQLLQRRPGIAFSASQVATALDRPLKLGTVSMFLSRLHHAGLISRTHIGVYTIPFPTAAPLATAVPLFDMRPFTKPRSASGA